jgi:hypothetical protein
MRARRDPLPTSWMPCVHSSATDFPQPARAPDAILWLAGEPSCRFWRHVSRVGSPPWHGRSPPPQRVRGLVGIPDRHHEPPPSTLWHRQIFGSRTNPGSEAYAGTASRGDEDPRCGTASRRPRGHRSSKHGSGAGDPRRRARSVGSSGPYFRRTPHHEESFGHPEFILRGRERLTSLRLAPIALSSPPLENPTFGSSEIRFNGDAGHRRRSPVEDHLHSGVRLVLLAQMLVEHCFVALYDDEPAKQFWAITPSARASNTGHGVRAPALYGLARSAFRTLMGYRVRVLCISRSVWETNPA